jgi:hypothetical protein
LPEGDPVLLSEGAYPEIANALAEGTADEFPAQRGERVKWARKVQEVGEHVAKATTATKGNAERWCGKLAEGRTDPLGPRENFARGRVTRGS